MEQTRLVSEIVYREDLYPRSLTNPERVQAYSENLEVLPPIEVNQHNILIDGWHRWTAHKKNGMDRIAVTVTETASEQELLFLAIQRNSAHGLQLSQSDKQDKARALYHAAPVRDRQEFKKRLAELLSVTERTVNSWLSRIDKDTKEALKSKIFDMWMACHTQQEIADEIGIPRTTVEDQVKAFDENRNLSKSVKVLFQDDFEHPFFNVWKVQDKSNKVNHFGNTEARWLENLLYLYTNPFDIVVDPFAGGASTIDICKKRGRRYFVSDRKPIVEREKEIRIWDVTEGLPPLSRWQDVKLVYLDPPYWKQAEGKYSKDPTDYANMTLEQFNKNLSELIHSFAKKLAGAYIALIIQPTQWNAPNREYTDHAADMIRSIKLPIHMRFQCPYESQQANAQMMDWSRVNKTPLVLSRELIVWRV